MLRELLPTIRKFFVGGFALGFGLFASLLISATITGPFNNFVAGQPISSGQINENFETLRSSIVAIKDVPRGSIIAWHKSLTGTPNLPDGWVECNGQTISDAASVYNGQTVPNLNGQFQSHHSRGVFLRGDVSSGTFEDDQFQGHRFGPSSQSTWLTSSGGSIIILTNPTGGTINGIFGTTTGDPITDGTNGTPRTGMETRPASMSVVWIIKIK